MNLLRLLSTRRNDRLIRSGTVLSLCQLSSIGEVLHSQSLLTKPEVTSIFILGVKWIESAFDANGHYRRFDPQMPLTLAARSGGPHDYTDDTPITASGYAFCVRTGKLIVFCFSGLL